MSNFSDKRVVVTGASGFLGQYLCRELRSHGAIVLAHRMDLLDVENIKSNFLRWHPIDYVFHIAGKNGGIAYQRFSADIFTQNTSMALNVLDACHTFDVKKVVSVVASCAYPEMERREYDYDYVESALPREIMREQDFLDGPPHPSVEAHAYAKRNLQLASKYYHDQYGLNAVCVCPTTLFGPGDSTDPQRTKVLMAIVKKVVDAHRTKQPSITFWGSGRAQREFLFVEDAARLIAAAADDYIDSSIPLNLGSGNELSIKELVEKVVSMVGYQGNIEWDASKPDGQLRKRLDMTKQKSVIPWFTFTRFDVALQRTIDWYANEAV